MDEYFTETAAVAQAAEAGALFGSLSEDNKAMHAKMIGISAAGIATIKDSSLPDDQSRTALSDGMKQKFGDVTVYPKTECRCASAPETTVSCSVG